MNNLQAAFWVVSLLVILAVAFDFMNGFHDAANSIATVVSTGVLKPQQAVVFAAFFNVVAISVFQMPAGIRAQVPALATAAPTSPPIRAWDEDEGIP